MRKNMKLVSLFFLCMLMTSFIYMQGCGVRKDDCTAPDGSTITINPASITWTTGGAGIVQDLQDNWTVRVGYPDGTPMPKACITISGALAVPSGYSAYQFQFSPASVSPNTPVPSGFEAQTDDSGQYTFSTLITSGTGTFKDTIYVQSGTNKQGADYVIN